MKVLAIGDSLIKAAGDPRGGWAHRFAHRLAAERGEPLEFVNEGVSGDTVLGVLERLPDALRRAPRWDLVIVGVGINDSRRRGHPPVRPETAPGPFREGVRFLLEELTQNRDLVRIAVAGIVPVNDELTAPFKEDKYYDRAAALAYADILREVATGEKGVSFFDFTAHWRQLSEAQRHRLLPDGLHPGPEGHERLADVAREDWDRATA